MKVEITIFGFLLFILIADQAIGDLVKNTRSKVCRNGLKKCGQDCYDPLIYNCLDGKICLDGFKKCGQDCYNPLIYNCLDGKRCLDGEQICDQDCYDPYIYTCLDGIINLI